MNQTVRKFILLLDVLWISTAFSFAYVLRYKYLVSGAESWSSFRSFLPAVAFAVGIWVMLYLSKNLDGFRGGWHLPTVFAQVLVGVLYLMSFLLAIAFLQRHYYSRLLLLYLACLLPAGLVGIRCAIKGVISSGFLKKLARRGVILGSGHVARELAYKIARHPEMLLEIVGSVCPSGNDSANGLKINNRETVLLQSLNVSSFLQQKNIKELIVVLPQPPGAESEKIISKCRETGMAIRLVPQWYELYISEAQMVELDGVPLISLEERNVSAVALGIKRLVDLAAAAVFVVITLPVLLILAVKIRRRTGRAFCKELRCSTPTTSFAMFRLNVNRDEASNDPFERMLVGLSLTELPQLWNVLRGEMSLVGPRPETPERVKHYSDWQRQRLSVKPGVTGLAQVHGLREQHSSEEKARFDLEYIFHWSLFLDFSLILQTAWTLACRLLKQQPRLNRALNQTAFGMIPEELHADRSQSSAD